MEGRISHNAIIAIADEDNGVSNDLVVNHGDGNNTLDLTYYECVLLRRVLPRAIVGLLENTNKVDGEKIKSEEVMIGNKDIVKLLHKGLCSRRHEQERCGSSTTDKEEKQQSQ